jgi:hypothetical protein
VFPTSCHLICLLQPWQMMKQLSFSVLWITPRALHMLGQLSTPELDPQLLFFWDRFSLCSPGWPWTHYVAMVGLKVIILLPPPLQCWDYGSALSCLVPEMILNRLEVNKSTCKVCSLLHLCNKNLVSWLSHELEQGGWFKSIHEGKRILWPEMLNGNWI